jgi:hypothetical protein
MHNMGVPIQPVNLAINASSRHHPTEDPEVQEVDRSQVSNNKGKKKVAQQESHSPRRKIEQFAQRFCMLAQILL